MALSARTSESPFSPSGFPSLPPPTRWTLVAIIIISSLLLVIWSTTRCYSRKARRHERSLTDALEETESTVVGLSRASRIRSLRWTSKIPKAALEEKTTAEHGGEGDLSDPQAGTQDTVIEISEQSRHCCSDPSPSAPSLLPGTSAVLYETSGRSTMSRSRDSLSTASIYSQESRCTSSGSISLSSGAYATATRSSSCSTTLTTVDHIGSTHFSETSLQVPAAALLRPGSMAKLLIKDSPPPSCASVLFQNTEPNLVFELAATVPAHAPSEARPSRELASRSLAFSRSSWGSSSGGSLSDVSHTTESSLPVDLPPSRAEAKSLPAPSAVLSAFSAFSLTSPPRVELGFGRHGGSYL